VAFIGWVTDLLVAQAIYSQHFDLDVDLIRQLRAEATSEKVEQF